MLVSTVFVIRVFLGCIAGLVVAAGLGGPRGRSLKMRWGSLRAVDLSRARRDVFWYSHARKSSGRQVVPHLRVAEGRALQFAFLDDAHVLLPVDACPLRFAQVVETPSEDGVEGGADVIGSF